MDLKSNLEAVLDFLQTHFAERGDSFMAYIQPEGTVETAGLNDHGRPVVVFKLLPPPLVKGIDGYIQPGALVTYLDFYTCIAQAADPRYWPTDRPTSTDDLKGFLKDMGLSRKMSSRFVRPIPLGEPLFLKCCVELNDLQSCFVTMTIYDAKNDVLFKGYHDLIKLYKPVKTNPKPAPRL